MKKEPGMQIDRPNDLFHALRHNYIISSFFFGSFHNIVSHWVPEVPFDTLEILILLSHVGTRL
jgi:hypothetical protein